jgi:hypothetical protein
VGSGIIEVVMPLSGAVLQWRAADGAYRVLLPAAAKDSSWHPSSGSTDLGIAADGEVWRQPSWLVGWGELPAGEKIEVLRTDATPVPVAVAVAGRAWICEWIGEGEPVTVWYDDGFPQTLRIPRPSALG